MKEPFVLEQASVRLVRDSPILVKDRIAGVEDAVRVLSKIFTDYDREVLSVINMRSDNTPINMSVCGMGTLNQAIAHPRELLKSSFLSNANAILLFHNHPSGNLQPSKEDVYITKRMQMVCELAGIPLLDHIILGVSTCIY